MFDVIPGTHETLLREPHVRVLANVLKQFISRPAGSNGDGSAHSGRWFRSSFTNLHKTTLVTQLNYWRSNSITSPNVTASIVSRKMGVQPFLAAPGCCPPEPPMTSGC